jgi:transposase
MPRYKEYSYEQTKMIPISYERQILPGSFEYALDHIIEHEIDLSIFKERYHNDVTGAPAFNPAILLKIILYAYSRGILSSRKIASCCEENVIFMALSADTRPHFTTIADFISSMGKEITVLFNEVLLICDEMLTGVNCLRMHPRNGAERAKILRRSIRNLSVRYRIWWNITIPVIKKKLRAVLGQRPVRSST